MSTYKYAQIIAVEYKTGVSNPADDQHTYPSNWTNVPNIIDTTDNNAAYFKNLVLDTFKGFWERDTDITADKVKNGNDGNKDDLEKRLAYFAYVSCKQYASSEYDKSKETLKCILWPEFYWCPYSTGAYSKAEYRVLKKTLREVQKLDIFKDTLIVNGTIIWKLEKNESRAKNAKGSDWQTDPNRTTYFNTSLINYKGAGKLAYFPRRPSDTNQAGTPEVGKHSFIIQKAYMSHIDGVPGYKRFETKIHAHDVISANDQTNNYYRTRETENKHVFTVDGLKVGVEICLEHATPTLENAIKSVFRDETKNSTISILDIQLLTACGMGLNPQKIYTKYYGVAGRSDGFSPGSSCAYSTPANGMYPPSIYLVDSISQLQINNLSAVTIYPPLDLKTPEDTRMEIE